VRERKPPIALPLFPLYVDRERSDVTGLTLNVVRGAAGTSISVATADGQSAKGGELGGYVLDLTAFDEPLTALFVALPDAAGAATMRLKVDASDDLAAWRRVVSDATLVNLEHAGRRLTRDRIEFAPTQAKYLRLSWSVGRPAIDFTAVSGEFGDRAVEAARQWREATGTTVADREGEYEFDLLGAFPVDRIELLLPEQNSVVPAQLLARATPKDAWQPVASAVFYRLQQPGGEVTSAPVGIAGGERRYWLLRVDPRSGGLGREAPRFRAGWQPQELVFAARGPGPFMLAYGSRVATPGALPIATLVPGYDPAKGLPDSIGIARSASPTRLGGPDRLREPVDTKRGLLWASLVLGALMLGWMAWRLSRDMGSAPVADSEHDKL
jgi:hypothetical protein